LYTSTIDYVERDNDHNFSVEMLNEMLGELNRLITKYGSGDWANKPTASSLVELLMEHAFYLQMEVNEVRSGRRKLKETGFLGPKTREARRRLKAERAESSTKNLTEKEKRQQEVQQHNQGERKQQQEMEVLSKRLNDMGQNRWLNKRRGVQKARNKIDGESNKEEKEKLKKELKVQMSA